MNTAIWIDPARQTISQAIDDAMGDLGLTYVNLSPSHNWNNFVNDFFDRILNDPTLNEACIISEFMETMEGIDVSKYTGETRLLYIIRLGIYNCWWALQSLDDGEENIAWSFTARANRLCGMAVAAEHALNHLTDKSAFALAGIRAKLARDPKQAERKFVLQCWRDWKTKPDSYASKAAFARDMLEKCEHLVSSKKIEDWCRIWERTQQ